MMADVVVTQGDREAALGAYYTCYENEPNDAWMQALLAGKHDDDPQVIEFARHRIAAFEAGLAEGRQQALEEAAKAAEAEVERAIDDCCTDMLHDAAAAIRAIGDKP